MKFHVLPGHPLCFRTLLSFKQSWAIPCRSGFTIDCLHAFINGDRMPATIVRRFARGPHSKPKLACFVALLAALLLSEALNGQSTSGTVLGTVKESSGAVVPGAMVSLTNAGTNAKHSTVTSDTGTYQFVNLEVGTYQLTIEATGFQKSEFTSFDLTARETKR